MTDRPPSLPLFCLVPPPVQKVSQFRPSSFFPRGEGHFLGEGFFTLGSALIEGEGGREGDLCFHISPEGREPEK